MGAFYFVVLGKTLLQLRQLMLEKKKSPIKGRMPSKIILLGIYYEKVFIKSVYFVFISFVILCYKYIQKKCLKNDV